MSTTDPNVAAALLEAATIVPKLEQQFGMNVGENGKRAVAGVLYQQKHGGTFCAEDLNVLIGTAALAHTLAHKISNTVANALANHSSTGLCMLFFFLFVFSLKLKQNRHLLF